MEAELQTQIAFYLTGRHAGDRSDELERLDMHPALFSSYRDLNRLRYDFPLVLARNAGQGAFVQSLSGVVDGIIQRIATGGDAERLTRHVLRLEQEFRVMVHGGTTGPLQVLWDAAAQRLAASGDELVKNSLERARAALATEGEVIGCDASTPSRVLRHAWRTAQEAKAAASRAEIERLALKLSDILKADYLRSASGVSAQVLKASVGTVHDAMFDFEAMSRMLASAAPKATLPASRRERLRALLAVLNSQRFFPAGEGSGDNGVSPYVFEFDSCTAALQAYRERLDEVRSLSKAIAIAKLEIDNEYVESRHDAFFQGFGEQGLDSSELALFPDYLVCANVRDLQGPEDDTLMAMLAAGMPVKILAQTDDVFEPSPLGTGLLRVGSRCQQLASAAISLGGVYVLQSAGSHLYQMRGRIADALAYSGPALFSVYSGATADAGPVPAYLRAAAAMESRAFPAFSYDPSAGADWASRFCVADNPQPERDWPLQDFGYEDEAHQRVVENIAFTLADFVACDRRYAGHFAAVPREKWNGSMIPVDQCVVSETRGIPDKLPCVLMVDRNDVLQKVIVDDRLIREARRCRDMWRSVQELGGIHNSHAERLIARERKAWEETVQARASEPAATAAPAPAAAAAPAAAPEPEAAPPSDEPYIETPRCSSCDECTQINNKMFAYDENKQARIVNLDAGTYRQLVEAAESCQVAIIHPGKPRNPNEPGLEELLKRAEPFL